MNKHVIKDLPDLVSAGIITEETAEKIKAHYDQKALHSPNRLILVFGILGALLMGLGVILIVAHNWDELSRDARLICVLLPLLIAQALCAYTLYRKPENQTWREAASLFLLFAIAASVSMVSQIYNIPGSLQGFLFIWMLLSIPLVYVMRSAMTSLLVICGLTWYACIVSYFNYPTSIAWYYWLLLGVWVPFFWILAKEKRGNFFHFHQWFFAFSIIVTLGMFNRSEGHFMYVAYMSLFSLFVLVGETKGPSDGKIGNNAFLVTGSLGGSILLLILSFEWVWEDIARAGFLADEAFAVSIILSVLAALVLLYSLRVRPFPAVNPQGFIFVIIILLFGLGRFQPAVAQWLTNVLVLLIALITTWRGVERDNIVLLNYGLLIMAVLILCRFFDTEISFVIRGIVFLVAGTIFFAANYWLLKKRKLENI